jgi:hypothetical protein
MIDARLQAGCLSLKFQFELMAKSLFGFNDGFSIFT